MDSPKSLGIYLLTIKEYPESLAILDVECGSQSLVSDVLIEAAEWASIKLKLHADYGTYHFIPAVLVREPTSTLRARVEDCVRAIDLSNIPQPRSTLAEVPHISWNIDDIHIVMTTDYLHYLEAAYSENLSDIRLRPLLLGRAAQLEAYRAASFQDVEYFESDSVAEAQEGPTDIHAGRPMNNRGPPTTLFSPEIARFVDQLDNLDRLQPSHRLFSLTHTFIHNSCSLGGGWERDKFFDELFGEDGNWKMQHGRTGLDGRWGSHVVVIMKEDEGIGGEPRLRGALDRRHYIASEKFSYYVKRSNCPSIIIGLAGPHLTISVSIFTNGLYVDHLRTLDLTPSRDLNAVVSQTARVFVALQAAVIDFKAHYDSLDATYLPPSVQTASFPFPHPIAQDTLVELPTLTFIDKLSRCGELADPSSDEDRSYILYLAKLGPSDVVVKFTRTYHEGAHRLLAEHQLAPHLHGVYPVQDGFLMVVMEKVEGLTAWEILQQMPLPRSVLGYVGEAVRLLHERGLVHGDLRSPNIMVSKGGNVKIIDFDWTAEEGKGRYPVTVGADPVGALHSQWHRGVQRGGLMKKEHDEFLRDRLRNLP